MILGLGHDVVDVAAFAAQLSEPGTRMRSLFSAREMRQSAMRGEARHDGEAVHLAARWAGKEAVLKAWCEALARAGAPAPYTLDDFPWTGIEILDDSRGVPRVVLRADVGHALVASLAEACAQDGGMTGEAPSWHISLSHDGPVASAVAILESRTGRLAEER